MPKENRLCKKSDFAFEESFRFILPGLFENDERFIIQKEISSSSWFGFSFIIKDKNIKRENVIEKLTKANIDTRPIVSGNFAKKEVVNWFDSL